MKKDIGEIVKKYSSVVETIIGISAVVFLIYTMRSLLILGETTFIHDNLLWNYPVFQFFAENIINGHFPLWDPFSHAGEPFYPILGQMRLFEPVAMLTIYLGKFITHDIVMLFNWNRFIQSLIMAFGVYIVFRPLAANLFIKLSLIPILLFSSFFLGSFRQDAILNQFLWVPFIAYFLLRIIYYKDYRWHNWLLLAAIIGLNWQSYFFTGTWIFLLFFVLGIILFYRNLLTELFKAKMIVLKLSATAVIVLAMSMPNIVLMLEKNKYVFPARMVDLSEVRTPEGGPLQYESDGFLNKMESINMPYSVITFTGTFSSIWDFIQIISPDGNNYVRWPSRNLWGKPSEAYMYLGFLPWAIALLGLVAGRHDLKRLWLLILISFGLLRLGPPGGLHRLLYYTYPPVWFLRHTHTFVLFFIFALLYFYVLGFNHIFSTWGSRIFPSNHSQGILGRLYLSTRVSKFKTLVGAITRRKEQCISALKTEDDEKNIFRLQGEIQALESVVEMPEIRDIEADSRKSSKGIATLIFSACIITSVYLMTKLTYPETNYTMGIIALLAGVGWFLRKDLGRDGLYVSMIAGQIALVLIFSANTFKFLRYILPVLGLPALLFIFIKSRSSFSKGLLRYAPLILLAVFSSALISDLVYNLRKSTFLYQGAEHPAVTRDIETTVQKPFLPQKRLIYPEEHVASTDDEKGMRYLSLLYRQPFVFSSIMGSDYSGVYVEPRGNFSGLTNGSFEDWFIASYGKPVPKQFIYYKEESGGGIEKYTGYGGVKHGKASVLLKPSSNGNSFIRYKTSDIDEIRGQYIRISLLVKSQNSSSGAIQMDLQLDNKSPILRSYNNSGDWEKLTIVKYIDENAEAIAVTCNIKSFATAPVYLDGLAIEIVDVNANTFAYALKSKRWSSFLLLKNYFKLVNMDISPSILEAMFAVDMPMFQFKQGVVSIRENEIPAFLKQLGDAKSVEFLKKYSIVEEQDGMVSEPLLISSKKYDEPAFAKKEIKDAGNMQGERDFVYAIRKYEYNSFDMQVSVDQEGILYWADGYDKNWHAYIGGKEVPIYQANINFKAMHLPKGKNTISFVYKPVLFKIGLFVFYGTLALCFMAAVISRKIDGAGDALKGEGCNDPI